MTIQLNILEAIEERNKGIQLAKDHADAVEPGWSERAYDVLKNFLISHYDPFMAEDIRSYAALIDFELPPSARAWGGVIVRAAKDGYIKQVGYSKTKNVKAHRTPAALWRRV